MFRLLLELNVICEQKWIQFELDAVWIVINGYSLKVPAEFLHLMANYTLPFSKPVKSDHN